MNNGPCPFGIPADIRIFRNSVIYTTSEMVAAYFFCRFGAVKRLRKKFFDLIKDFLTTGKNIKQSLTKYIQKIYKMNHNTNPCHDIGRPICISVHVKPYQNITSDLLIFDVSRKIFIFQLFYLIIFSSPTFFSDIPEHLLVKSAFIRHCQKPA